MEDDLILFENGRQPNMFENGRRPTFFENGRRPQLVGKWKMTSIF